MQIVCLICSILAHAIMFGAEPVTTHLTLSPMAQSSISFFLTWAIFSAIQYTKSQVDFLLKLH